jgi:hypothetical protein
LGLLNVLLCEVCLMIEDALLGLLQAAIGPSSTDMMNNFIENKIAEQKLHRKRRRAALKGWRTRRSKR